MAKPLISDRTLRSARGIAERAMQNTGTIVRPRVIDNGAGGTRPDPAGPLRTATPCSITPVAALPPGAVRDQVAEHGKWLLSVPLAADLKTTDQFEVLGQRYQITWAPTPDALSVDRMAALTEA
jgi:hypothetical protein